MNGSYKDRINVLWSHRLIQVDMEDRRLTFDNKGQTVIVDAKDARVSTQPTTTG